MSDQPTAPTVVYYDEQVAKLEEYVWPNGSRAYWDLSATHVHKFKRYTGLQKIVDYCDCGFEQPVDWKELNNESDAKNEDKASR